MDGAPETTLCSTIHAEAAGPLAFLRPAVRARDALRSVFEGIIAMMWGELRGEADRWSELQHMTSFLVFSALSLAQHHAGDWTARIVGAMMLAWAVDQALARRAFGRGECRREVLLSEEPDGGLAWRRWGDPERRTFLPAKVRSVLVSRKRLRGGVFREVLGSAWRGALVIDGGDELPLFEAETPGGALAQARGLAERFRVPLKVAESEGTGPLAQEALLERVTPTGTITARQEGDAWEFATRWTPAGLWSYAGTVVESAGFLFFVLGVARLMSGYGALLDAFVGPWFGWEPEGLVIDLRPGALLGLFDPTTDPLDFMEFLAAAVLLLLAAWRLGRRKTVLIDARRTRVSVGDEVVGALTTATLTTPILVQGEAPVLLLVDHQGAVELGDLHGDAAYRELAGAIEEGLMAVRPHRPP